jgi:hypothetical protein
MESSKQEREVRAARNQALFRSINEKLRVLNETFASMTETFSIACECADATCIEMVEIDPHEYVAVRAEPRHFIVMAGHVYSEVERVVREAQQYVVVEKTEKAAEVAELLAADGDAERR